MMDLALPRINGIEAARRIRETVPGTGVIILSAHDRAEYMKEFLKEDSAGKAYLLKESLNSTRDLVRTIQDVAVGRTVLDPVMVSKLTSSPNVQINSSLKGLTSRELQVLSHMAQATVTDLSLRRCTSSHGPWSTTSAASSPSSASTQMASCTVEFTPF